MKEKELENRIKSRSIHITTIIILGIYFNICNAVFFNLLPREMMLNPFGLFLGLSITMVIGTMFLTWKVELFNFAMTTIHFVLIALGVLMFSEKVKLDGSEYLVWIFIALLVILGTRYGKQLDVEIFNFQQDKGE